MSNYKIVYVLVSTLEDFYYEQLLMSVVSLKRVMPDSFVTLLTDDKTASTLQDDYRGKIKEYIQELKVVEYPRQLNNLLRSRYLKTTMRKHIEGNFFYLDVDTIITKPFGINGFEFDMGAILERHIGITRQGPALDILLKKGISFSYKFYNGGIFWCRDTPQVMHFFEKWNEMYMKFNLYGIWEDQLSLNYVNSKMKGIITPLDGIWNCQICVGGLPYLSDAKVIHYSGISKEECPFILGQEAVQKKIREQKAIPDEIKKMLEFPQKCFDNCYLIGFNSRQGKLFDSKCYAGLKKIYYKYPQFSEKIESVLQVVAKKNNINNRKRNRL